MAANSLWAGDSALAADTGLLQGHFIGTVPGQAGVTLAGRHGWTMRFLSSLHDFKDKSEFLEVIGVGFPAEASLLGNGMLLINVIHSL